MELVHEMTWHARLRPPMPIGGPFGQRTYFDVIDGQLTGARINGTWRSGGDWGIIGEDGFVRLDVRAQLETDDGAFVLATYPGLLQMNEVVQAAMESASETQFGDQYFRTTPRFETGDERYRWLTQSVFVGEGRLYPGFAVEYQVYRVS
jgi:hypothetical protein